MTELVDAYWRARAAGDVERAAQLWKEMGRVPFTECPDVDLQAEALAAVRVTDELDFRGDADEPLWHVYVDDAGGGDEVADQSERALAGDVLRRRHHPHPTYTVNAYRTYTERKSAAAVRSPPTAARKEAMETITSALRRVLTDQARTVLPDDELDALAAALAAVSARDHDIVTRLAAHLAPLGEDDICALCCEQAEIPTAEDGPDEENDPSWHHPTCPWRMAREARAGGEGHA
jgi:hypothetical protein